MAATNNDVFILFPLTYIIPTYILYTVELFTMFVNRRGTKFAGSFFNIWVSSAINNLICSILYFVTYRGSKAVILGRIYSIIPSSGFFITLILFIVYGSGSTQVVLDLVLCFNRFTVVWMGTKHVTFWKKYCKIILFIAFCIPAATTWETWFFDVKLSLKNASDPNQGYVWNPTNTKAIPWMQTPLIICGTVVITATLSFLMNCYVCWYLLKQKKNKNGGKMISKQDLKLFLYNLLIFLTQAVQFCLQMVFLLLPPGHILYSFAISIQFFVMDVNSLAPAWFILFMSSALRTSIMDFFGKTRVSVFMISTNSGVGNHHLRMRNTGTSSN
ncbi:hypothetical protein FO519_003436 [Halicephalobus sp. NKZ332]|nr:hypothetical protein FO519_003436 [Halicephalobus sp. NKZ332]